jgi:hypothetical protein
MELKKLTPESKESLKTDLEAYRTKLESCEDYTQLEKPTEQLIDQLCT